MTPFATRWTVLTLLIAVAAVIAPRAVTAQDTSESQGIYSSKGFYIKPHVVGVSWTVEDDFIEIENESGQGLGLGLGYGFSDLFSIFAEWSGATVYDNEGDGSYGLYHLDLGARFTLGKPTSKLKFLLEAAGSGRVAEIETVSGNNITASGTAGTAGGGIQYFVSRQVALEASLSASVGEMSDIEINGETVPTGDLDLQTVSSRFHLGISWWP